MRRERNYYTEQARRIQEIELELMLDGDDTDDDDFSGDESTAAFMDMVKVLDERLQHIPNQEKIDKFEKLAKKAEAMAEMLYLNIVIESDERMGRIEFSRPDLLIPAPVDAKAKKTLAWLIAEANDISISSEQDEETVHVRLLYELYDEHYVWIDKL